MKKYVVIAAALALFSAAQANAQGLFNFSNFATAFGVNAPVFESDGTTKLGNTYKADFFWGAAGTTDASTLVSGLGSSPVTFAGGGVFLGGEKAVTGAAAGTTVTMQVRAWRASDGASYAIAAATPGAHFGEGNLIQISLVSAPTPSPAMVGLQSFNLHPTTVVPEPTTIALGVMGAAALLFRRRK